MATPGRRSTRDYQTRILKSLFFFNFIFKLYNIVLVLYYKNVSISSNKCWKQMKNILKSQERNINTRYKEGPNEILKLKNTMTDMKNSLDWLNGK